MLRLLRFAVYLLVAFVGLAFALLNAQSVPFNYYLGSRDIPLAFIVAVAVAFGALLGVAASMILVVKSKRQMASYRRSATMAEKELAYLRSLSANDHDQV